MTLLFDRQSLALADDGPAFGFTYDARHRSLRHRESGCSDHGCSLGPQSPRTLPAILC